MNAPQGLLAHEAFDFAAHFGNAATFGNDLDGTGTFSDPEP